MANIDWKSPGLHKLIASLVLSVIALVVFFGFHVLPFGYRVQQEHLNVLKAEYEKKSTDLARARTTVADLPRFEAEYGQLHEQWLLAAELLPTDRDLPTLLRKISLSGQQTGIQFMMFRPSPPRAETYYSELPVEISVQGGYHAVGSFLAELSNLRRIVTVSNLRMKSTTKSDDPNITTSAEFTASAYSLNTTAAAPAGAAATADKTKKKPTDESQGDSNAHKGS